MWEGVDSSLGSGLGIRLKGERGDAPRTGLSISILRACFFSALAMTLMKPLVFLELKWVLLPQFPRLLS